MFLPASSTFTSTWLALSFTPMATVTSWPASAASHVGQKLHHWLTLLLTPSPVPSLTCGYHHSVSPLSLLLTAAASSSPACGGRVMTLMSIRRFWTASYHPQANGAVEHFQRQLKASLMALGQSRENWQATLTVVLLRIRASLSHDFHHSSAEFVYGTTVRLPGKLFCTIPDSTPCSTQDFGSSLKESIRSSQPMNPSTHPAKMFVYLDLDSCSHVFVKVNAVKRPMQPPYEGPFKVLRRTKRNVTINRHRHSDVIVLDRVKPAYLLHSSAAAAVATSPATPDVPPLRSKKNVEFLLTRHYGGNTVATIP